MPIKFFANGDMSAVAQDKIPLAQPPFRICANGHIQANSFVVANTGVIRMYMSNGTFAYGTSMALVPPAFVAIHYTAPEQFTDGAIVNLNAAVPLSSTAQTMTTGNQLIFFGKHQNVTLNVSDNVGGNYMALTAETPFFGDELIVFYNNAANANSQNVNVSSSGGGNIWEGFLYEFQGILSITGVDIVGNTADGSGNITGNTYTVPTGSILIARCSSSGAAVGSTVSSPGTQLGPFNTAKGVLGQWTGAGSAVTPTFSGTAGSHYTVYQMILNPFPSPVTVVGHHFTAFGTSNTTTTFTPSANNCVIGQAMVFGSGQLSNYPVISDTSGTMTLSAHAGDGFDDSYSIYYQNTVAAVSQTFSIGAPLPPTGWQSHYTEIANAKADTISTTWNTTASTGTTTLSGSAVVVPNNGILMFYVTDAVSSTTYTNPGDGSITLDTDGIITYISYYKGTGVSITPKVTITATNDTFVVGQTVIGPIL